jgi:ribosomal protein L37AE/L43A
VSAKTAYWACGRCGFKNHPRMNQDIDKCEQCGATRAEPDAADLPPEAVV